MVNHVPSLPCKAMHAYSFVLSFFLLLRLFALFHECIISNQRTWFLFFSLTRLDIYPRSLKEVILSLVFRVVFRLTNQKQRTFTHCHTGNHMSAWRALFSEHYIIKQFVPFFLTDRVDWFHDGFIDTRTSVELGRNEEVCAIHSRAWHRAIPTDLQQNQRSAQWLFEMGRWSRPIRFSPSFCSHVSSSRWSFWWSVSIMNTRRYSSYSRRTSFYRHWWSRKMKILSKDAQLGSKYILTLFLSLVIVPLSGDRNMP